jgi:hypothetical protein
MTDEKGETELTIILTEKETEIRNLTAELDLLKAGIKERDDNIATYKTNEAKLNKIIAENVLSVKKKEEDTPMTFEERYKKAIEEIKI